MPSRMWACIAVEWFWNIMIRGGWKAALEKIEILVQQIRACSHFPDAPCFIAWRAQRSSTICVMADWRGRKKRARHAKHPIPFSTFCNQHFQGEKKVSYNGGKSQIRNHPIHSCIGIQVYRYNTMCIISGDWQAVDLWHYLLPSLAVKERVWTITVKTITKRWALHYD